MNADGSSPTQLTTNDGSGDAAPHWSPDGSKIAFDSGRGGNTDIYVVNADGTGLTRLTNNPEADEQPNWQRLLSPSPSPTPHIEGGSPSPTSTGAVGGLVDLTTNSGADGWSGTTALLAGLLLAFAATGAAVFGFRRASSR